MTYARSMRVGAALLRCVRATLLVLASTLVGSREAQAQVSQRDSSVLALFPSVVRVDGVSLNGDVALGEDGQRMTLAVRAALAEASQGLHIDIPGSIQAATTQGNASAGLFDAQTLEQLRPRAWVAAQQACFFLLMQRRYADAVTSCERAVQLDERAETYLSLALARYAKGSREDEHESERTLQTLTTRFSSSLAGVAARCYVALDTVVTRGEGHSNLVDCAEQMQQRAPNTPTAEFYAFWASLAVNDAAAARRHADAFDRAGHNPTYSAELRLALRRHRPWWSVAFEYGAPIAALWFALVTLVLLWTRSQSLKKQRALEDPRSTIEPKETTAKDRRDARAVLAIATTRTITLSIAAVVVTLLLGTGALWVVSRLSQIPIGLVLSIMALAGAIGWVAVKGITDSPKVAHTGVPLVLRDHPELETLLRRCASLANSAPIEEVYVTTATNLEVYSTEGVRSIVGRAPPLYLRLGVGLIDALDRAQLEALVTAELARAQRAENYGGAEILQITDAFVTAWPVGAAGLFVGVLARQFRLAGLGIARAQEFIADRIAAKAFGAELFESALRAFVTHNETFFMRCDAVLLRCHERSEPLLDLCEQARQATIDEAVAQSAIDKEWNRTVSDVASQLSPRARVERVRAYGIEAPSVRAPSPRESCWGLFVSPERLRERCTELAREAYAQRTGVVLNGAAPTTNEGGETAVTNATSENASDTAAPSAQQRDEVP